MTGPTASDAGDSRWPWREPTRSSADLEAATGGDDSRRPWHRPTGSSTGALVRAGLWTLLLGWLYGTPTLLLTGLLRSSARLNWLTQQQAEPIARTTDALLTAGLVLNGGLPLVGVAVAAWYRDSFWRRRFALGLIWAGAVFLVFLLAATAVPDGVFGRNPGQPTPEPVVTRCIPRSGGHGCPGG